MRASVAVLIAVVVACCAAAPVQVSLKVSLSGVAPPPPTPPRPNIPSDFLADTEIEDHDSTGQAFFGEGYYAVDTRNQRQVEHYDLDYNHERTIHIMDLERYDLHTEYTINSEDVRNCTERNLTGTMQPPFSWVAQATYNGSTSIHGVTLDLWVFSTAGISLALGVDQHSPNTPVTLERRSTDEFTRYFFRRFIAAIPDPTFFTVPQECPGPHAEQTPEIIAPVVRQPAAPPARPNPPSSFAAFIDVEEEEHGGPTLEGNGIIGADQKGNRAVERYDIRPDPVHQIHELFLQRYDLGKEYFLTSEDPTQCHVQGVNGTMPPVWGWLANATYTGQINWHGMNLDNWEFRFSGDAIALAVASNNPNVPVLQSRESIHSTVRYFFRQFNNTVPDSSFFTVPSDCPQ